MMSNTDFFNKHSTFQEGTQGIYKVSKTKTVSSIAGTALKSKFLIG